MIVERGSCDKYIQLDFSESIHQLSSIKDYVNSRWGVEELNSVIELGSRSVNCSSGIQIGAATKGRICGVTAERREEGGRRARTSGDSYCDAICCSTVVSLRHIAKLLFVPLGGYFCVF